MLFNLLIINIAILTSCLNVHYNNLKFSNRNFYNGRIRGGDSSNVDTRNSRLELLLGSHSIDVLKNSRVLIIGANELTSKVATHLLRSGIVSIDVWDEDYRSCYEIISKVKILNKRCNVNVSIDLNKKYSVVICLNKDIQKCIELNKILHDKSKFIYADVRGVYGVVLTDFGSGHLVNVKSDYQHPEHKCSILNTGPVTCIEVEGIEEGFYNNGDLIQVTYPKYLLKGDGGDQDIDTKTCNIIKIVKAGKKLHLYINLDTKGWPKFVISVVKIDDGYSMDFPEIGKLLDNLSYKSHDYITRLKDLLFDTSSLKTDDTLVISTEKFDIKSFITEYFYKLYKYGHYEPSTTNIIHSQLLSLKIPPSIALVSALVAQEAIKGITNIYKPSKIIIINRSDIFKNINGNLLNINTINKVINKISDLKYLLVGCGALGCDYLQLFAEMNIKNVIVLDNDIIELSNLTRQCLFTENDVGKYKAETAIKNLKLLYNSSFINYKYINNEFNDKMKFNNDITISAVDNMFTRLLLDNYAIDNLTPFIEAGIHGMQCKLIQY